MKGMILIGLLFASTVAQAEVKRYEFVGLVNESGYPGITPGDEMLGSFTIDLDKPAEFTDAERSVFEAVTDLVVEVNGKKSVPAKGPALVYNKGTRAGFSINTPIEFPGAPYSGINMIIMGPPQKWVGHGLNNAKDLAGKFQAGAWYVEFMDGHLTKSFGGSIVSITEAK
jgi:hypothetical protein